MSAMYSGHFYSRSGDGQIHRRGDFLIDKKERKIFFKGRPLALPPCAYACLEELLERSPEPVTYKELVCVSLGIQLAPIETQDYARWRIDRLRRSIEPDLNHPYYLRAIPGLGYILYTT